MKTYPRTGNPICPYSKKECLLQDMDGYTDCKDCSQYGHGVKATGAIWIPKVDFSKLKRFLLKLLKR